MHEVNDGSVDVAHDLLEEDTITLSFWQSPSDSANLYATVGLTSTG